MTDKGLDQAAEAVMRFVGWCVLLASSYHYGGAWGVATYLGLVIFLPTHWFIKK